MKVFLKIGLSVMGLLLVIGGLWLYTPDKSQADLEATYATEPSVFVELPGVRVHVRDTGPRDAPAVILLHGFGASLHTWETWADILGEAYRVIRLDLPGFALTGPDETGDYSDTRTVEVLRGLMDELDVARATFIGNSMGGRMAWKFAAAVPDRVDKLVLISPDGFASPGFEYGKAPEVPASLSVMRYVLPKSLLRMSLEPAYADPSVMSDNQVTRYHDLMIGPGVRGAILARMEQAILVEPEPLLRQIEAPTLIMWGEQDGMIPFTNAADYLSVLPNSELISFPDLGHLPHEEEPEKSIIPVQKFLAK